MIELINLPTLETKEGIVLNSATATATVVDDSY